MKMLVITFAILLSACSQAKIYDLKNQKYIEKKELIESIEDKQNIVLGEYHYQPRIQQLQGELIKDIVIAKQVKSFSLSWEFFEYDLNKEIQEAFNSYKNNEITSLDFFKKSFPTSKNPEQNMPYIKSIDVAKNLNGSIVTTNATREVKKLLMESGRRSLEAKDQPLKYLASTENYLKRFKEAMGGHVGDQELKKYFEAQHYTDQIIASKVFESRDNLNFLIVGSFHSDYNDGVVRAMKSYDLDVLNIKIIDINRTSADDLNKLKEKHEEYGPIADYLIY